MVAATSTLETSARLTLPDPQASAGTMNSVTTACKLKTCRKVAKTGQEGMRMRVCEGDGCSNRIHSACLAAMLADFEADDDFGSVVCGKRCNNAVCKKAKTSASDNSAPKKRIPWHNDGMTPSISSLSCLMDWITTGENYRRYRGGEAQSGETKLVIAGEVVRLIERSGVPTVRNAKDVMTKISSLESSFKLASDCLANTGEGIRNEEGMDPEAKEQSIRGAILKRCPYYDDLLPIMNDRASTRPLRLNTAPVHTVEDSDGEQDFESCEGIFVHTGRVYGVPE